ncbi:hypothetical protein; 3-mannosyl-glycoprotein 4-beta-N-acetylglucosaminyltransferase B [Camelus dromedarius]|uniref:MGAT4 conserved region domain-containing protein n=1 Tax=Camelus dromedarius TaxID=9838 RepID=A0A5N4EKU7_CAMDR|nr:hypothetical protein; 3-mannosyl-glycoprotein 4-beta-N-acetylglucosaminyltransferase B [Camelus dromedarius]
MILEFSQLGFIGKMFKWLDLSLNVEFILMFCGDKPVDWLLDHTLREKLKDKDCGKQVQRKRNVNQLVEAAGASIRFRFFPQRRLKRLDVRTGSWALPRTSPQWTCCCLLTQSDQKALKEGRSVTPQYLRSPDGTPRAAPPAECSDSRRSGPLEARRLSSQPASLVGVILIQTSLETAR